MIPHYTIGEYRGKNCGTYYRVHGVTGFVSAPILSLDDARVMRDSMNRKAEEFARRGGTYYGFDIALSA